MPPIDGAPPRRRAPRVAIRSLRCLRCGHEWTPRQPVAPRQCPGCGRAYWWEAAGALRRGRPPKKRREQEPA